MSAEYSVEEVRAHAAILRDWRSGYDPGVGNDDAAEMLEAYAERIKADEGTVPVAVVDAGEDGLFVEILYGADGSPLKVGDKLFIRPPAQAAQAVAASAFVVVDAKGKKFTVYNPDLANAIRSAAKESGSSLTIDAVCKIPNHGWFCTRGEGHEGPCAAWPNAPHTSCPTYGGPATRHEVSGAFEMRDEYRHVPTAEPVAQKPVGDCGVEVGATTHGPVAQVEGGKTLRFEEALAELIEAVDPSIESGDILVDAHAAAMIALKRREPVAHGEMGEAAAEVYEYPRDHHEPTSIMLKGICFTGAPLPVGTKLYANLPAQPRAVPDGWALVPREPTLAMKQAAHAVRKRELNFEGDRREESWFEMPQRVYEAMLAAAPSPGESA